MTIESATTLKQRLDKLTLQLERTAVLNVTELQDWLRVIDQMLDADQEADVDELADLRGELEAVVEENDDLMEERGELLQQINDLQTQLSDIRRLASGSTL